MTTPPDPTPPIETRCVSMHVVDPTLTVRCELDSGHVGVHIAHREETYTWTA